MDIEHKEKNTTAQLSFREQSRLRLFGIYLLTVCGIAATVYLVWLILENTGHQGLSLPFEWLATSVIVSAIIFVVVMKVSSGLNYADNNGLAYFLLCLAPFANALLACTLPRTLVGLGFELEYEESLTMLTVVFLLVSVCLIVILPINILIGYGGAVQAAFRWMVNVVIIFFVLFIIVAAEAGHNIDDLDWDNWVWFLNETVTFDGNSLDVWWVGLVVGSVFAGMVKELLKHVATKPQVPAPALAACLVSGSFIIYLVIRFAMKTIRLGS